MSELSISFEELKQIAARHGLLQVGFFEAAEAYSILAKQRDFLSSWQEDGFAAEMSYMQRDVDLFTDPARLFPELESIVCFLVPYSKSGQIVQAKAPLGAAPIGFGKVARYAWGMDYHQVLKSRLKALVSELSSEFNFKDKISYRVFSDAVPLLERALGSKLGQGFIGKNTMLIQPGQGSYFFIAEILWNVRVEKPTAVEYEILPTEKKGHCGSCTRCQTDCPTGAFSSPYRLDANRCISYLTIEKRGLLSPWESSAIGDWLFGCDICQEVCPFNHSGTHTETFDEFKEGAGAGAYLNLKDVLSISDEVTFKKLFGKTALMRTGREGLLRNATCVVANTKNYQLLDKLIEVVDSDSSELVRRQAVFSLEVLQGNSTGDDRQRISRKLRNFLNTNIVS